MPFLLMNKDEQAKKWVNDFDVHEQVGIFTLQLNDERFNHFLIVVENERCTYLVLSN